VGAWDLVCAGWLVVGRGVVGLGSLRDSAMWVIGLDLLRWDPPEAGGLQRWRLGMR